MTVLLLLIGLGGLVFISWYNVRTWRHLARHRPAHRSVHIVQWTFAVLAGLINLYLILMVGGIGTLILIGRPIVS